MQKQQQKNHVKLLLFEKGILLNNTIKEKCEMSVKSWSRNSIENILPRYFENSQ